MTQPSRLTVVESVYHQSPNSQPIGVEARYGRLLATDEQPYVRKFTVGPQRQRLPLGWLAGTEENGGPGPACVGLLCVANDEGRQRTVMPTPEERASSDARLITLAVAVTESLSVAFAVVRPGESCRFEPSCAGNLIVWCEQGEVKCTLTALPR